MRILFTGGGTAGHINPAVAVANYIREKESDSEILFIGGENGMESTLVPKQGYDIKFIKIQGFSRKKISRHNFKTCWQILGGIRKAKKIIKEFKPDVVMGTGGYVTGPVLYAAAKMKIPTLVHEANAYPGITVRILAKYTDVVTLSLAEAGKYISQSKRIEITGNPVRPSILAMDQPSAKKKLKLDERKVILIFGGSLGAEKINEVAVDWISKIADDHKYQIIMSTGKSNQYDNVIGRFESKGIEISNYPEITVSEYIYDMDLALNAADLIIARSGGSVCEMTALGKASILIPSPNVAENHQEKNARAVESSGGAVVIVESELSEDKLAETVERILGNSEILKKMNEGSRSIGIPDATERIYKLLKELIKK